jgi:hypothetical protein
LSVPGLRALDMHHAVLRLMTRLAVGARAAGSTCIALW